MMIRTPTPTRATFQAALAAGHADLIEARLGWLSVRIGDVLTRHGRAWATADGRVVPGWAVAHHWGSAFVPVGYRPVTPATLLERRARFGFRRRHP